jgi:hypothetical protein
MTNHCESWRGGGYAFLAESTFCKVPILCHERLRAGSRRKRAIPSSSQPSHFAVEFEVEVSLRRKAGFPLGGILRAEWTFSFSFLISSIREITRQRKIPLRAQNSA